MYNSRGSGALLKFSSEGRLGVRCLTTCLVLFAVYLLAITHVVPCRVPLMLILVCVLLEGERGVDEISCSLLTAFVTLFVFVNGLKEVPRFDDFLREVVTKERALATILTDRVVDGIPTTLLLSNFASGCQTLVIKAGVKNLNALVTSVTDLVDFGCVTGRGEGLEKGCLKVFATSGVVFVVFVLVLCFFLSGCFPWILLR